jgi:quercetin dioxygenase-like cupin family protein
MTDATQAQAPAHAVAAGKGDAVWFNGAHVTVKLPGAVSGDGMSLVEVASTQGRATGLHTDPSHETFYVLEGELLFHVEGDESLARAGDTVSVRQGARHAFIVVSPTARFLVMNAPGTHDRFFLDGGVPATDRDFAAAPPPDLERTAASANAHGVAFLGPPPFDPEAVRQISG